MLNNEKESHSSKGKGRNPQPTGPEERRGYIRTDASVSMALRIKQGTLTEEIQTNARNVSATGMMIEIEKKLPVDSEVMIDLNPPDTTNPVHCSGKIVWSTPAGETGKYNCGIEFTKIEEDNKNTFLKFLCDAIYKASGK